MSVSMHLYTALHSDEVLNRLKGGKVGSWGFGPIRRTTGGRYAAEWRQGVFCVETPDQEDLLDLQTDLRLPPTFQTRLWFNCQPSHEGQTDVYQVTSTLLKEWDGDLALLHDGDSVRVQRVNGQVSLREDFLSPQHLTFYQDIPWKQLPPAINEA